MLKIGCIVLSVWGGVHLVGSAWSLIAVLLSEHAWIMKARLSADEIAKIDAKVHPISRYSEIMQTSCAAAFSALVLVLIWKGLRDGHSWAFWALLFAGIFYQAMWLAADPLVGNRIIFFNIGSSIVLLAGLILVGYGLSAQ